MPNWIYILVNGVYLTGVAIWFGGGLLVTFGTGPALSRARPEHEAAAMSASILHSFAKMRAMALMLIVLSAGAKFLAWERNALSPWIAIRWGAIVLMAWALLVELRRFKGLRMWGSSLQPGMASDDALRQIFEFLRIRVEGLMRASLIPAFVALLLS